MLMFILITPRDAATTASYYSFSLSSLFSCSICLNIYSSGDCLEIMNQYPGCIIHAPFKLGNGYCDSGEYSTEQCKFDGGDCVEFNAKYSDCLGIL